MEAATDRFAHELVGDLVQETDSVSIPDQWQDGTLRDPVSYYVYRDCTGQLTQRDIHQLQDIERGQLEINASANFKVYLRSLRLFVQFVNLRYQQFLAGFGPDSSHQLHHLIIQSMLSGKMKQLCACLDTLRSEKKSFPRLFKVPHF